MRKNLALLCGPDASEVRVVDDRAQACHGDTAPGDRIGLAQLNALDDFGIVVAEFPLADRLHQSAVALRGTYAELARALRLDDVERAHLHVLAAPATTRRHAALSREAPQRPDAGLLRLIDTLDHVPVLLLGRRGDILARNALLVAVLGRHLHPGTSFLRYLFCDQLARALSAIGPITRPRPWPACVASSAVTLTTAN